MPTSRCPLPSASYHRSTSTSAPSYERHSDLTQPENLPETIVFFRKSPMCGSCASSATSRRVGRHHTTFSDFSSSMPICVRVFRFSAQANYLSGNMTDTLTFRYTVVEGDSTDRFDILDTRTNGRQRFSTALVKAPAAEVGIGVFLRFCAERNSYNYRSTPRGCHFRELRERFPLDKWLQSWAIRRNM